MKQCTKCNLPTPLSDFYKNGKRLHAICKTCHKEYIRLKYLKKIEAVSKYKSEKGCSKCGDKRYYVLEFHHIDPTQKDYLISARVRAPLNLLMEEIKKCAILCSNCHAEFHHFERQYNTTIEEYLLSSPPAP